MKDVVMIAAIILLAFSNLSLWTTVYNRIPPSNVEPELAESMQQLQRYLQKLELADQGGNNDLFGFYLHEMEELTEAIVREVPQYEGFEIANLMTQMLTPQIQALSPSSSGDRNAALEGLVAACNACHQTTDHGYIRIIATTINPYNQDFH